MIVVCPSCAGANRLDPERARDDPVCGKCGAPLLDGKPVALDDSSFDAFVAGNDLPVVIDFWAQWCAPCRMMAPTFDATARDLKTSMRFAKVDVDTAAAVARRFGVSSIPTLVLFRHGAEVLRVAGAMSLAQLKSWILETS